jgi:hypothetical protein
LQRTFEEPEGFTKLSRRWSFQTFAATASHLAGLGVPSHSSPMPEADDPPGVRHLAADVSVQEMVDDGIGARVALVSGTVPQSRQKVVRDKQ